MRSNVSHGVQVAQVAHAAGESAGGPLPDGTIVVALAVLDESALREVAERLTQHGIAFKLIIENEGLYTAQAMAIGCAPTTNRAALRRVLSQLPLVK